MPYWQLSEWRLSYVAVVHAGTCPGVQLSCVAIVLGGNCRGWQLSWVAVFLDGSCPTWQLSWVAVDQVAAVLKPIVAVGGFVDFGIRTTATLTTAT